jgi:hypothetical protein
MATTTFMEYGLREVYREDGTGRGQGAGDGGGRERMVGRICACDCIIECVLKECIIECVLKEGGSDVRV